MKHKRDRAQSMVEFALLLPILLLIIFALIDAALAFQGYLTVAHAARESVRFAIVYRPNQGECLGRDAFGNPIFAPYPDCPIDFLENPNETDAAYYDRRSLLIKRAAIQATTGLRAEIICDDENSFTCVTANNNESGMLGVRIWGFQTFNQAETPDMPGLQGLPVRVQVIHNVPLVIFGTMLPNAYVQVSSITSGINEGVQVGFGNMPPPTFGAVPPPAPPGTAVPPVTPEPPPTPGGPTPIPTPIPLYTISLNFETALNELPDERAHVVIAHVRDKSGNNVAGARVTFRTDFGSFSVAGVGAPSVIVSTDGDGLARTTLYTNRPGVSNITAWLNYNNDGEVDPEEPSDTAIKIWQATGPYLIVSNHNPAPNDWLAVSVMDHPVASGPFSLWWCPASITATQVIARLAYPINVDPATWDLEDIPVNVPLGVAGTYRIESHSGDGGANACGQSSRVAYSGIIETASMPPDLIVQNVTVVDEDRIRAGEPVTLVITVTNQSPVAVTTGPFDVDIYMPQDNAPQLKQIGLVKQWVPNLPPLGSFVITATVTLYTMEPYSLWVQVDTSNYVNEGDAGGEDNNLFGPVELLAMDCFHDPVRSDNFNGGLGSQWQTSQIGSNSDGTATVNGAGQLELRSRGDSLWGGNNNAFYLWQAYPSNQDFDIRVRVLNKPTTNQWAKTGLHARQDLNANAPYAMNMATNYRNPAGEQAARRLTNGSTPARASGSNDGTISLPVWLRMVRENNDISYYYSYAEDYPLRNEWVSQGTQSAPDNLSHIGIINASYNNSQYGTGVFDEFVACVVTSPAETTVYPPGLTQCSELLVVSGFEGNADTVFSVWKGGDANGLTGAIQRTSAQFRRGSFSMRLHASNGTIPCENHQLQPYLYQEVTMPTEVFTFSTVTLAGHYFVEKSILECSLGTTDDSDDVLDVNLYTTAGTPLLTPQRIIDGGTSSGGGSHNPGTWYPVQIDLEDAMSDPTTYAGQTLRMQWDGFNDGDVNGTFFYLDDVSLQVCTTWPIPDDQPGTASIGGLVRTRGQNNLPVVLPGADVWAYTQGGQVLQTRSIHDGTYHFYNLPPGAYIIYAEAWMSGQLRTAISQITVTANERNYNVNLLLQ